MLVIVLIWCTHVMGHTGRSVSDRIKSSWTRRVTSYCQGYWDCPGDDTITGYEGLETEHEKKICTIYKMKHFWCGCMGEVHESFF